MGRSLPTAKREESCGSCKEVTKPQTLRPYLDELQIHTNAAIMEDGHNQRLCKLNTLYKMKSEDRWKDRLSLKSDDLSDLME